MKTSRQRLLEYIQTHPVVSAAELSQALKMTQANARHHINILLSQGLLEVAGERAQPSRGRPSQLYRISQQAFGNNLDHLAHAALVELRSQAGEENYLASIKHIANHLAGSQSRSKSDDQNQALAKNLSQRLVQATAILNQLNYSARWEAHRDGPRILLGRCPYQSVITNHPELCQMDTHLLSRLCGVPVELIARLIKDPRGATYCLFRL